MFTYKIDKSDSIPNLNYVGYWEVPRATQGISFYRYHGTVYLITSNSWKRKSGTNYEHKLIVYKPTDYDKLNAKGGNNRNYHKGNRICDITIPSMSEQVSTKSTSLLLIFESYAKKYRDYIEDDNKCSSFFELDFYKVCME